MRVSNLVKEAGRPLISFEFFPPRTEKAAEKFDEVIDELASLGPDYVTVTFGAGGSTVEGSYQLVEKLINEKKLPTVAYIAGYGLGPDAIVSALDAYKGLGVETIFVIRGDAPQGDRAFEAHPESMRYASDMISFIKDRYDFCLGCAGYPEGHIEAESKEKDLEHLKLKVDEGAEYVVAQYTYLDSCFPEFVKKTRSLGLEVPILPGIMPIYSVKMTRNLARICGAELPESVDQSLENMPADDKQALLDYSVELATKQCRALLDHDIPGLHFYTMDRAEVITRVIENLKREGAIK